MMDISWQAMVTEDKIDCPKSDSSQAKSDGSGQLPTKSAVRGLMSSSSSSKGVGCSLVEVSHSGYFQLV